MINENEIENDDIRRKSNRRCINFIVQKWRNLIVTILENSSNELFAEAAEEKSL